LIEKEALAKIDESIQETIEARHLSISIGEASTTTKTSMVSSPLGILQENFVDFERNITCISSKLLREMSYDGQGIGKRSQGIIIPIVAKPRVKHEGLIFSCAKDKAMINKITFVKAKNEVYLAFSIGERATMNEYGSTLPLHAFFL
jgi:hypothetical protein